jgi:type IV pilus assembly protein PilC
MSHYICKLGTSDNRVISREFEASEPGVLRRSLEEQGYFVFDVRKKPISLFLGKGIRRGVTRRTLLLFNQELLTLIKAGMPILQALDVILERKDDSLLFDALKQLREDVKGGDALSSALERHRDIFPSLYTASIRAGERTGGIPVTIQRYVQYMKKVEVIRKKLVSALFYPGLLVIVSLVAVGFLLLYVFPVFSDVYKDAKTTLPLLTRMLMSFTTFLKHNVVYGIIAVIAAVFGFRAWVSRTSGRYIFDRMKLRLPFVGSIMTDYALTGFTRTLANLMGSGIPIVESLHMSTKTLNNAYMEKRISEAINDIEAGGRLSSAFERTGTMSPMVVRMLGVGETTGALEEMLVNVSEHLEESLEERMQMLTTLIEPAIMIVMGLVVGAIIVAMYLPIFQIAGTVSQG